MSRGKVIEFVTEFSSKFCALYIPVKRVNMAQCSINCANVEENDSMEKF